jgi:hypothetical protein
MRVQRLFYYLWYCWWFNNDSIQPIFSLVGVSLLPIQRQQPRRSNGPEGYGSIPWLARPGQHHHQHQAATGPTSTMLASSIPSSSGSTSSTALEPPAITMDHLSCTHDGGEHWQLKDVSFVLPRGASTYIPTHTHAHSVYRNVPLCVSSSISLTGLWERVRFALDVLLLIYTRCAVAFFDRGGADWTQWSWKIGTFAWRLGGGAAKSSRVGFRLLEEHFFANATWTWCGVPNPPFSLTHTQPLARANVLGLL